MLHKRIIIDGTEYKFAVGQCGKGAPTEETVGCIGVTYMDESCGTMYKCTKCENGKYTWEPLVGSSGLAFDGGYLDEKGFLHLTLDGKDIPKDVFLPFFVGAGGNSGGNTGWYTVTLSNLMPSRVITVAEGNSVILRLSYTSVDGDGMDDGSGIGQLLVGGLVRETFPVSQGEFERDVSEYLRSGDNEVVVRVTNSENTTKSMTYSVHLATVRLSSSFDASVAYDGSIPFPFTAVAMSEKTLYVEVDGGEPETVTVTTNNETRHTIPALSHGSHTLRVWFTCEISGITVTSNELYYGIICTESGRTEPIIAITSPPVDEVEQYTNIVTRYRVYDPTSLSAAITLEANGAVVGNLTVDRTEQAWSYQPPDVGELTQIIRCGDTVASRSLTVTESSMKVEAETEALELHLSSYGRSNNEANPGTWESGDIAAEFSRFNFASDGWVLDDDDITVLRVTGDARLHIPYKIFASDFRTTGKTLEFELATREVLNYDAEVLTCYSGGRGFIITAQQLMMASEQSGLGSRYKEDEHIRVSIVAEKRSQNRLLLCYINGIMSGAVQYPDGDDFAQASPVGISVGSNECTVDLYNIRVYDNGLTRHQILDNWIADTQNFAERVARYQRNQIYDAYGNIVIGQLPDDLPYMVLQSAELPQFKGDKKAVAGYFTDPLHPERSFTISGAEIDVQGTSSQYYYRKNYKIKFKQGFVMQDGSTAETYQMNNSAFPTNVFTMKADVASSESAFNVVLSMLYNELCPFRTPAQLADPRVRQTIEGFPMVMFWDNGSTLKFLGKYNFNNDKGTAEVFGFQPGDESWEIRQNGTARVGWHSADFSDDSWKNDFEARYPEDNEDTTRLQQLAEWLMSTDTDQATGNAIAPVTYDGVEYTVDSPEYRLAKFSAELSDHFIEEAIIFYYLFTEIFLSIDQREKNAFPTYIASLDRWIVLFYDADSSCGTDNKGNLTFDYYLEDIDYTQGGDPIYNGQNSVLWRNLRETRRGKITAMYKGFRTRVENGIGYESVIGRFAAHQGKWPEAIFNEDMQTKYLEPLIGDISVDIDGDGTVDGAGIYLPMLQGKKEMWMQWWLYNRFRYLDSKYETGTSMENRITIRTHAKGNVTLTSYVNMYGRVYYNAEMVENRMNRGQAQEFVWAATGAEDAVLGINDADMLTSLGDLSPLIVELIDASKATHLTGLKIGDASEDYRNYSLNSITLGNNKLLRTLDVRNCPNLEQSVDISGCTNIEEVYFDGTSVKALTLPDGGVLKKLHLPETVTNITVINQPQLSEFHMPDYSGVTTLRIENAGCINPLEILPHMADNSRVRILDINMEAGSGIQVTDFLEKLNSMRGLDETGNNTEHAQVSGYIHVDTVAVNQALMIEEAKTTYPALTIEYENVRNLIVRFWNRDVLMATVEDVPLGGAVTYPGPTPTQESEDSSIEWRFMGWSEDTSYVDRDLDCYAEFANVAYDTIRLVERTLRGEYENSRVTTIGTYAFVGCGLTDVSFPNVVGSIPQAFSVSTFGNGILASISFPNAGGSVGTLAFISHSALTNIHLPKIKGLGYFSMYNIGATVVDFPSIEHFAAASAFVANKLKALVMRKDMVVGVYSTGSVSVPSTCWIYVPRARVDEYKTVTGWSKFGTQFRALEDYTVDGTITGELDWNKINGGA